MGASCSCFLTLCGGMCYVGLAPDPLDIVLAPITKMADHIREQEAPAHEGRLHMSIPHHGMRVHPKR